MGWASGVELLSEIIDAAKHYFSKPLDSKKAVDRARQNFYVEAIEAFEGLDCDVVHECRGSDPAFDAAYEKLNPEDENDDQG